MIRTVQVDSQYISWLEQEQVRDPANVVLAHDLGLTHYCRALTQNGSRAAEHWERVIANWSLVLDRDDYWRDWCADRTAVYGGITITDEHIADLKKDVRLALMERLTAYDQADSASYLRFVFPLESKAIRLLREAGGFSGGQLVAGPLLAWQLGVDDQVWSFFEGQPYAGRDTAAAFDYILEPLQDDQNNHTPAEHEPAIHQLRVCFSELGLPAISLEQGYPLQTLELLAALRCANCESEPPDEAHHHLPVCCREDCARFARANPSYAALRGGTDLFFRDAMALGAFTCLWLARQHSRDVQIDAAQIQEYLRRALEFSRELTLAERLRRKIGPTLLGWANSLERADRWDEAVELLDIAAEFEDSSQRRGQLAGLLNQRGVRAVNEHQESPATPDDLRQTAEDYLHAANDFQRACALSPGNKTFRDNLTGVVVPLRNLADAVRKPYYPLHRRILTTIDEIERGVQPEKPPEAREESEPREETARKQRDESEALPQLPVLPPDKIYHTALFDEHGHLTQKGFLNSGWAVLMQAQAVSAEQQKTRIRVPALVLALAPSGDGVLGRLLQSQGVPPQGIEQQAARYAEARGDTGSDRLRNRTLSQYDFESDMLEILVLAWKLAQYTDKQISEFHLVCGLLLHPSATRILDHAADQMIDTIMNAASLEGLS